MSVRHTIPIIIVRTAIIVPLFIIGCLAIVFTQLIGLFLFKNNPSLKQAMINETKTHFVILLSGLTSIINPCKFAITIDTESVPNSQQFHVDSYKHIHTLLQPNSVIISNHQIYTDWLFLWFLTYTSNLSNAVYIILKDLSKIPVLGYGMKNYNFLFLSRKWEHDKVVLTNQLLEIDANARGHGPANGYRLLSSTDKEVKKWPQGADDSKIWPYELILFPEGTVPSDRTTKKSAEYIASKGLPPLKHVLLPRIRGLYLALQKLRNTVEVVYDVTTAYSGLKEDEYGELVFSLKKFYIQGYGPPVVNYFIKGYKLKDIPLGKEELDSTVEASDEDLQKFEDWLLKIWYEKDQLMDNFYKTGQWGLNPNSDGEINVDTKLIVGDFKLKNSLEFLKPFIVSLTILLLSYTLLSLVYSFVIGSK
ncbi:hypothetical protein CORT_0F03730 [Candida orthopsilosis Co 90-125]|uniref:Phospholipid/glycerol acyltransferase domain-containing protein n=1 Tax=Candida orthopsilosis (strain 90-125) TaxID=1136231 RepID=H8X9D0_CANO9|nr:hypothetical protein CORT_0F03730 [Candida orthopsilosis Co 90-125]CCG24596.1 hypothetical protein CORT_0F03730 [Candida orthopsilosis Co 90-125]